MKKPRSQKRQVGAALLVFGVAAWFLFRPPGRVPREQVEDVVRAWLVADYGQSADDPLLAVPGSAPNATQNRETVTLRGFEVRRAWVKPPLALHAAVARTEILVNHAPPLDGENVRYFLLEETAPETWKVRREISESAFRWRLGW